MLATVVGGEGRPDPSRRRDRWRLRQADRATEPRLVLADVLDGYLTRKAAKRDFGVAITPRGRINKAATAQLRSASRRAQRLPCGTRGRRLRGSGLAVKRG